MGEAALEAAHQGARFHTAGRPPGNAGRIDRCCNELHRTPFHRPPPSQDPCCAALKDHSLITALHGVPKAQPGAACTPRGVCVCVGGWNLASLVRGVLGLWGRALRDLGRIWRRRVAVVVDTCASMCAFCVSPWDVCASSRACQVPSATPLLPSCVLLGNTLGGCELSVWPALSSRSWEMLMSSQWAFQRTCRASAVAAPVGEACSCFW